MLSAKYLLASREWEYSVSATSTGLVNARPPRLAVHTPFENLISVQTSSLLKICFIKSTKKRLYDIIVV